MTKLEKVQNALIDKTRNTGNWITITTNVDVRHNGKYAIRNIVTNHIQEVSYKTLDEIIREYKLEI